MWELGLQATDKQSRGDTNTLGYYSSDFIYIDHKNWDFHQG